MKQKLLQMKKILLLLFILLITKTVFTQTKDVNQDSIIYYFNEIKTATKLYESLWGVDLYGPILLVNPDNRQAFSLFPDSLGVLKFNGRLYTGYLPNDVNFSNTGTNWNGVRWAMIILPLFENKYDRVNLLAHELFHKVQPSLGFNKTMYVVNNNHLDKKEGRVYLRLELEALKKAVQAQSDSEMKVHLLNAAIFRKYRHSIYKEADSTENVLESNEGIAEYTGVMISGRNNQQMVAHFIDNLNGFLSNPTFVRSFAYQTVPVYGYLLSKIQKDWNKSITCAINLTDFFIKSFNLTLPDDLQKALETNRNLYNGKSIVEEETKREERIQNLIREYKNKFVEQPHLEISLEKMNVSFNPYNLMPVDNEGTYYPTIRITDKWGILESENGALMGLRWEKVSLTNPTKIDKKHITGAGWKIELNDGYILTKDPKDGNYKIVKK
jgi:hypothetical protein